MSNVIRIDVRKSRAEAEQTQARHAAKGLESTIDSALVAVWNWAAEGAAADVVASDADGEVWVVITKA